MRSLNPTLGSRDLFPALQAPVYLNHSAISPPSKPVMERIAAVANDYSRLGLQAFFIWHEEVQRLKRSLATLIGAASSDDLALTPNTTFGVLAAALCFPWRRGDGVMVFRGEFPTNVTPWQRAAALYDLKLFWQQTDDFRPDGDGLQRLEEVLRGGEVRLVAVSAVQFQTGLRMPIKAMAKLCHRYGAELFVDAIQAVGAVPLDVEALGIDYLACGAHKWLMGTEGAGFLYIKPGKASALRPHLSGWLSHEEPLTFLVEGAGHLDYERPIRKKADFLESGVSNTLGLCALSTSVDLLLELGVDAIFKHINGYLDLVEPEMIARGFISKRTISSAGRSGIASFVPPGDLSLSALSQGLQDRGVSCSTPDGHLRFAPHWPNNIAELPILLDALDSSIKSIR